MVKFPHNEYCPWFQHTFELLGKRWTAAILRAVFSGRARFVDIAEAVPGLSNRLLGERLNDLIDAGLVVRCGSGDKGYGLTAKGCDLRGILEEVEDWNRRWIGESEGSLTPTGVDGITG